MGDKPLPNAIRIALEPEEPKHTAWLPAAKCDPELRAQIEDIAIETGHNYSSIMRAAARLFVRTMRNEDIPSHSE